VLKSAEITFFTVIVGYNPKIKVYLGGNKENVRPLARNPGYVNQWRPFDLRERDLKCPIMSNTQKENTSI